MASVKIYVTTYCSYCDMAKRYLDGMEVSYESVDVTNDPDRRAWLVDTTGKRTVPQIFVGDEQVGGFTDLRALDRRGDLLPMLERNGISYKARG